MRRELEHLINVVHAADQFKQRQLAAMWPELAEAVTCLIEGTTEHDAPREWHTQMVPPHTWTDVDGADVYHEADGNVPIAIKGSTA